MTKATFTNGQLQSIVERIERLNSEQDAINNDKKEVYSEAKGNGFDVKALKIVVQQRAKEAKDREGQIELGMMVDLYLRALSGQDGNESPSSLISVAGNGLPSVPYAHAHEEAA